jgi:serpin B
LAFDEYLADFSGISEDELSNLRIAEIFHQAVIEVNEEGTVAAAATAIFSKDYCKTLFDIEPQEFICNRPFLFVIHDKISNNVLFFGKLVNPQ